MRPLDVPEMMIGFSVIAILAWAVYNWRHRRLDQHK
jgi:hypothetical protein